ncbi:energy transducer TonB [Methylocapsa acidiphila]|uniref:energy transducer TonB n=1 Tax=Methylocapsa acidiphila TaxID=133552 RepID=UPI0003FC851F|nr:energy transducer TonB [Methylocapsa acidiphila]
MSFKADPDERLIAPPSAEPPSRKRLFALLLAMCFLIHAGLLALLLLRDRFAPEEAAHEEEIPVEVVVETPPPEPEPPPQQQQKQPKEPPKPKVQDDEKPAFDAPRTANQETVERDAPDKQTQSPRVAPMTKHTAEKPSPEKKPQPQQAATAQPEEQTTPQKFDEDKPEAEALDKAAPEPPTRPQDKPKEKKTPVESKTPPGPAKKQTVADQLAALNSLPDYKVGSLAKPAPVAGGTERTTYLSILFGLIMRQMHYPPGLRERHVVGEGIISFYVDERGNLTHQAVYRTSGLPELDSAALNAVRRAAPFPAPPRGDPHAIWFHFDTR